MINTCSCCERRQVVRPSCSGFGSLLCVVYLGRRHDIWRATRVLPGSHEKIEIMRECHRHMLPVFHPDDPRMGNELTGRMMTEELRCVSRLTEEVDGLTGVEMVGFDGELMEVSR